MESFGIRMRAVGPGVGVALCGLSLVATVFLGLLLLMGLLSGGPNGTSRSTMTVFDTDTGRYCVIAAAVFVTLGGFLAAWLGRPNCVVNALAVGVTLAAVPTLLILPLFVMDAVATWGTVGVCLSPLALALGAGIFASALHGSLTQG